MTVRNKVDVNKFLDHNVGLNISFVSIVVTL